MNQLEAAVLYAFDPNADPNIKQQASAYCDQFKQQPDAWKFCVQQLGGPASTPQQFTFWCLQVLGETIKSRHASFQPAEKIFLQQAFMAYIREILPNRPDPVFIKNKVAQLIVQLIRLEYPEEWPDVFTTLLTLLQSGGMHVIDMFFRILTALDDEVASLEFSRTPEDQARNTIIKDAMRVQCVPDLVNAWYSVLIAYHSSSPNLCKVCLNVMSRYIAWIDITLVASDRFLPLIFNFLNVPALREEACDWLLELVTKRMEPGPKIAFLDKLRLTPILQNVALTWTEEPCKLSNLTNKIAMEIMDCITKLTPPPDASAQAVLDKSYALIRELLPLVYLFVQHNDEETSSNVLQFVQVYVGQLKRLKSLDADQVRQCGELLRVISKKIQYDEGYQFEKEGEEEVGFQEYRKDLFNIFKNIVRMLPDMTKQFVRNNLTQTLASLSTLPFPPVEGALAIVYQLGEGLNEEAIKDPNGAFGEMLNDMIMSNVSSYQHRAVQVMYFENIVRYCRTIAARPQLISSVLAAFLDTRGMRNSHPTVRARAYYLFLRFVKTLRQNLSPFLDSILQSVQDLLAICRPQETATRKQPASAVPLPVPSGLSPLRPAERPVADDDQVSLFEAVGLLLGSDVVPPPTQARYLQMLLAPLLEQVQGILSTLVPAGDQLGPPFVESALCHLITCLGHLSKGFPVSTATVAVGGGHGSRRDDTWSQWKLALEATLNISYSLPLNQPIHARLIFFLHRMVDCLGPEVLPYLPPAIRHLLQYCSLTEFNSVITLLNQVIIRFKAATFDLLNDCLTPLSGRVFDITRSTTTSPAPSAATAPPTALPSNALPNGPTLSTSSVKPSGVVEEDREKFELYRGFYTLLAALASNDLYGVLTTPLNLPSLNDILLCILNGCLYSDMLCVKQCFAALARLVEVWAGPSEAQRCPGFNTFVLERIAPAAFHVATQPTFNPSDATTFAALGEIVALERGIANQLGPAGVQYLVERTLPSAGLNAAQIQEFVAGLQAPDTKPLRMWFKAFSESKRMR